MEPMPWVRGGSGRRARRGASRPGLQGEHVRIVFRFRKEKAQTKTDDKDRRASNSSRRGILVKGRMRVEHRRDDICREKRCGGPNHSTTNVRGKRATGAAEMDRKNLRQVFT